LFYAGTDYRENVRPMLGKDKKNTGKIEAEFRRTQFFWEVREIERWICRKIFNEF